MMTNPYTTVAVVLLAGVLISGTLLAAKPATETITLNQPTPHFSDVIDFTISIAEVDEPWVHLQCSQNGTLVQSSWRGYYGNLGRVFQLGPTPSWQGGAADCIADAGTGKYTGHGWRFTVKSSTSFAVLP